MMILPKTLLLLTGLFFATEGASNLVYWRNRPTRRIFQFGRLARTSLGVLIIAISVLGA